MYTEEKSLGENLGLTHEEDMEARGVAKNAYTETDSTPASIALAHKQITGRDATAEELKLMVAAFNIGGLHTFLMVKAQMLNK